MPDEGDTWETSEDRFFSLMEEQAALVAEATAFLRDALRARGDITKARDDLKALDVMHLVRHADLLDNVADHTEAAADRLRALIAR